MLRQPDRYATIRSGVLGLSPRRSPGRCCSVGLRSGMSPREASPQLRSCLGFEVVSAHSTWPAPFLECATANSSMQEGQGAEQTEELRFDWVDVRRQRPRTCCHVLPCASTLPSLPPFQDPSASCTCCLRYSPIDPKLEFRGLWKGMLQDTAVTSFSGLVVRPFVVFPSHMHQPVCTVRRWSHSEMS